MGCGSPVGAHRAEPISPAQSLARRAGVTSTGPPRNGRTKLAGTRRQAAGGSPASCRVVGKRIALKAGARERGRAKGPRADNQAEGGRPSRSRLPAGQGNASLAHEPCASKGDKASGVIQGIGGGQGAPPGSLTVSMQLPRIAQQAKRYPAMGFNNVFHLIAREVLLAASRQPRKSRTPGGTQGRPRRQPTTWTNTSETCTSGCATIGMWHLQSHGHGSRRTMGSRGRPRSRRRPLSAAQHHPTTSLVGIS